MTITEKQLLQILPSAGPKAGVFAPALNAAMTKWGITTARRQAAFLAQIGHESGQFRYVRELGGDKYLAKYDTGTLAARLGNTPEADGDGQKYCGRGLIQITGRNNYASCGKALGLNLLERPELLEQPQYAAESAAWFWHQANLNPLADVGDFVKITRRINGGLNGLEDRQALWERARQVLGV